MQPFKYDEQFNKVVSTPDNNCRMAGWQCKSILNIFVPLLPNGGEKIQMPTRCFELL